MCRRRNGGRVGVGGGRLFEFEWEGEGCGVRVDAYSRLGAYSDKYGISNDCSGLYENPNNLDFLGRVLSGY